MRMICCVVLFCFVMPSSYCFISFCLFCFSYFVWFCYFGSFRFVLCCFVFFCFFRFDLFCFFPRFFHFLFVCVVWLIYFIKCYRIAATFITLFIPFRISYDHLFCQVIVEDATNLNPLFTAQRIFTNVLII